MSRLLHRPASSLAKTSLPWLTLRDHFFATVGPNAGTGKPLGALLVLADATFAPRSRFPLHPHQDMEILSIVIDGQLSHHGDQAHGETLGPRSAQLISARDGMVHAEGNDTDAPTRMLQLWLKPNRVGGPPAYFKRTFTPASGRQCVAGDEGMPLRTDAKVFWLTLAADAPERLVVAGGRRGYLMALTGSFQVAASEGSKMARLNEGDGAEIGDGSFELTSDGMSAVLWIDLA